MIYLIVGENSYIREQELSGLVGRAASKPEIYDGSELTAPQLADCIAGGTLFAQERVVVIRDLSTNKALWETLSEWLSRVSDTTQLVLIEAKPDKRTKAYKALAAASKVIAADYMDERKRGDAVAWAKAHAKSLGVPVTSEQVGMIVSRATIPAERPGGAIIDQKLIDTALRTLSLLDAVTNDDISTLMPESLAENVFELLETALRGDNERTKALLGALQASADGYMVFGVLTSQWCQLAALKVSGASPDTLSSSIGSSAYVMRKLQPYTRLFNDLQLRGITTLLANLDVRMKTTGADPWTMIDRFIGELCTEIESQ